MVTMNCPALIGQHLPSHLPALAAALAFSQSAAESTFLDVRERLLAGTSVDEAELLELLGDSSLSPIHWLVVTKLGETGVRTSESIAALVRLLESSDPVLEEQAALALAKDSAGLFDALPSLVSIVADALSVPADPRSAPPPGSPDEPAHGASSQVSASRSWIERLWCDLEPAHVNSAGRVQRAMLRFHEVNGRLWAQEYRLERRRAKDDLEVSSRFFELEDEGGSFRVVESAAVERPVLLPPVFTIEAPQTFLYLNAARFVDESTCELFTSEWTRPGERETRHRWTMSFTKPPSSSDSGDFSAVHRVEQLEADRSSSDADTHELRGQFARVDPNPSGSSDRRITLTLTHAQGSEVLKDRWAQLELLHCGLAIVKGDPGPTIRLRSESKLPYAAENALIALHRICIDQGCMPELLDLYREGSDRHRIVVAQEWQLLKAFARDAIPLLLEQVLTTRPRDPLGQMVRESADRALNAIAQSDPKAIALELNHPEVETARHVARLLLTLGPFAEPAIPSLLEALSHPDPAVRTRCLQTIASMGPQGAAAAEGLMARVAADPELRADGLRALAHLGEAAMKAVPLLIEFIETAQGLDRVRALEALLQISPEDERIAPLSAPLLEDGDAACVEAALRILESCGPKAEPSIPAILLWVERPDSSVRPAALSALRAVCSEALVCADAARGALAHTDAWTRLEACKILVLHAPEDAAVVPALVTLLNDSDIRIRMDAVEGLGTLGPRARAAVPELERLLEQDVLAVQRKAKGALFKITGS